jgi:DNA-directed RNA polymerase II subunit RPB2
MSTDITWKVIDKLFKSNRNYLVQHHLDSYNDFFKTDLVKIIKENNPIKLIKNQDPKTKQYKDRCELYLGGKSGNRIYYGKPTIVENETNKLMYPNIARLRNMTYSFSVHFDLEVFIEHDGVFSNFVIEKILLGRFPIMLQSDLCVLNGLNNEMRFNLGECRNDYGGYFVIDGKEKSIIPHETFANNTMYIRDKVNDTYSHSSEIRSVSEDTSKPIRVFSIRVVSSTDTQKNSNIVAIIPNVRKPIPIFILMRAMGIISDKSIIEHILLNFEGNDTYIDFLRNSVYDAGKIFTQEAALKYIGSFTKGKGIPHAYEIITDYVLPHIGEMNFKQKAYYLGYMTYRLLRVYFKDEKPTDRDNFLYKRIENTGELLYQLFREYYIIQKKHIFTKIDKEYFYNESIYKGNMEELIKKNHIEFFKEKLLQDGVKKAFKGNWGSQEHTKRPGVVQDLNRLSYNSHLAQLRKLNLPLDASAKVVGPRLLHSTQWGIIDPVDTPDGGNIGLHKNLAIGAHITTKCSPNIFIELFNSMGLVYLDELKPSIVSTKVFLNGAWIGCTDNPECFRDQLLLKRRNSLIPIFTSIRWNITMNEIIVFSDGGRLCRPIYYIKKDKMPSFAREFDDFEKITWKQLTGGIAKHKVIYDSNKIYSQDELYGNKKEDFLDNNSCVIEFIDTQESESCYIAMNNDEITTDHTHIEIHPSLALGIMGNQIVFPENNQLPRDLFSCGQSKQAVSVYHSNFQNRIDKSGLILNYGQIPLVKSRYMKYINNEEHPYGENAIVAIMSFTGYNVEDSVLINKASIDRGFFRTTYYNMYESYEESSKISGNIIDSHFMNVNTENVIGKKPGYDYSHINEQGLVKEETILNDKIIVIGKSTTNIEDPGTFIDMSTKTKKGQLGVVDKSFITEGEEGTRIAKVRIREERIPAIGDKVCSRCGQKGTIGLIIAEKDMPYTKNGLRPDIIINPHALPSRMTIGQLIETLMGKTSAIYGYNSDCTAFVNKGPKTEYYGEMLTREGFHSSGNEILYNGMTGEQVETEIFIGPTYYMRLKHMVKDKINFRSQGPKTFLTRQPVHGRANDGGLRIGEMERDCVGAHGASYFLKESMLDRGDDYYLAICNQSGTISVYNEEKKLFFSPYIDGPIKFNTNQKGELSVNTISKYGRSFSVVRVPYSFKLLMHELLTMHIQMRIITEDNIDQLTNLSYSDNYKMITGNESIEDLGKTLISKLKALKLQKKPNLERLSGSIKKDTGFGYDAHLPFMEGKPYNPTSPGVGPEYAVTSPDYQPQYTATSPPYNPTSPGAEP